MPQALQKDTVANRVQEELCKEKYRALVEVRVILFALTDMLYGRENVQGNDKLESVYHIHKPSSVAGNLNSIH